MNKLRQLKIERVALVDRGSNPDADIVLLKREAEPEVVEKATFEEFRDAQLFSRAVSEICSMTYTLESAISSSLYSDSKDRAEEIRQSVKQFGSAVEDALAKLAKGEPVTKSEHLSVVADRINTILKEHIDMKVDITKLSAEERAQLLADLQKNAGEIADPANEEILKGLSAEARELIKKANDRADQLAKDNEKTAERIAKMEADAERRDLVEKAKTELSHLPGTEDEQVEVLKLAKGSEALTKILKAANTFAKTGSKAVGTADAQEPAEDSAEAKLNKIANEIQSTEKVSKELAFAKACERNPELYDAMDEESSVEDDE